MFVWYFSSMYVCKHVSSEECLEVRSETAWIGIKFRPHIHFSPNVNCNNFGDHRNTQIGAFGQNSAPHKV